MKDTEFLAKWRGSKIYDQVAEWIAQLEDWEKKDPRIIALLRIMEIVHEIGLQAREMRRLGEE